MTDNKIIKALECCTDESYENCNECPYSIDTLSCERIKLLEDSLDLINRKQAEIERLQSMNQAKLDTIHDLQVEIERLQKNPTISTTGFWNLLCGTLIFTETLEEYNKFRRTFKSEAVKEFAERLENEINIRTTYSREQDKNVIHIMHNLLKEMAADTE